jgi:hypothetical protein
MFGWFGRKKKADSFLLEMASAISQGKSRAQLIAAFTTIGVELRHGEEEHEIDVDAAVNLTEYIQSAAKSRKDFNLSSAQDLLASSVYLMTACDVITRNTRSNFEMTSLLATIQFYPPSLSVNEPLIAVNLHTAFCEKYPSLQVKVGEGMINWLAMPKKEYLDELVDTYARIGATRPSATLDQ